MEFCPSFEEHDGKLELYPGIVQSKKDTCVFASIAGAINYVTSKSNCTEASLHNAFPWDDEQPTFGTVARCVPDSLIQTQEFHDRDSPLPDFERIVKGLQSGDVVILSLEYANISNGNVERTGVWHMLSVFRNSNGDLQVWDTGNHSGFFTDDEFKHLVCDDLLAVQYSDTHLVSHDAHHVFMIRKL